MLTRKFIYFNAKDVVEGVPQSQVVESVENFITENKLIDFSFKENIITFTKALSEDNVPQKGYALVFDVPNDFNS